MRGPRRRRDRRRVGGVRAVDEYVGSGWDIVEMLDMLGCLGDWVSGDCCK